MQLHCAKTDNSNREDHILDLSSSMRYNHLKEEEKGYLLEIILMYKVEEEFRISLFSVSVALL